MNNTIKTEIKKDESRIHILIEFTDDYAELVGKLAVYLQTLLDEKKAQDAKKVRREE